MKVHWKIHTPNLLNEVLNSNPGMGIFSVPFNILGKLLAKVGDRAAEINDPELNDLMMRLTIYSAADPASTDYDPQLVRAVKERAAQQCVEPTAPAATMTGYPASSSIPS